MSWNAQSVSRYELAYHPTSSIEWKSSVIFGMAVPRIVRSYPGQLIFRSRWLEAYEGHKEHGQVQCCHDKYNFCERRIFVLLFGLLFDGRGSSPLHVVGRLRFVVGRHLDARVWCLVCGVIGYSQVRRGLGGELRVLLLLLLLCRFHLVQYRGREQGEVYTSPDCPKPTAL